jgi:hypothetical protein
VAGQDQPGATLHGSEPADQVPAEAAAGQTMVMPSPAGAGRGQSQEEGTSTLFGTVPPAAPEDQAEDDTMKTIVKARQTCPNHPQETATDLCSQCHVAFCEKCITEQHGHDVCKACAEKA